MTIEEVLNFPAEKLEKITDKEWLEFIEPYLKVTRPELAEKPISKSKPQSAQEYQKKQKRNKAQGILASLGISLDDI